jgi:hypothetical protein
MPPKTRENIVAALNRQLRKADKLEPEYLKIEDCFYAFGVSRGFLFPLLLSNPPQIKSVHIKQPGRSRGIRLVNVQSLREYLARYEVGLAK